MDDKFLPGRSPNSPQFRNETPNASCQGPGNRCLMGTPSSAPTSVCNSPKMLFHAAEAASF